MSHMRQDAYERLLSMSSTAVTSLVSPGASFAMHAAWEERLTSKMVEGLAPPLGEERDASARHRASRERARHAGARSLKAMPWKGQ